MEIPRVEVVELFVVGAMDVSFRREIFGRALVDLQAVVKLGVDRLISDLIGLEGEICTWRVLASAT